MSRRPAPPARRPAAAGAIALVAVAAACGGDPPQADVPPAFDAYRVQVEASCTAHARRADDLTARRLRDARPGALVRHDLAQARAAARQAVRVRRVAAPPALRESHFNLIRAHADHSDAWSAVAERARAGDAPGRRAAERRRREFAANLRAVAAAAGLRACARPTAADVAGRP